MKAETRFNTEDIVYFLSTEPNYIDQHYLKVGEIFIIKGKIGNINITGKYGGEYDVEYQVYINALGSMKKIRVHESMLAGNREELGNMVANDFYVSGETHYEEV